MSLLDSIPKKPHAGVYGDSDVYAAYKDLIKSLDNLLPQDTSLGNLSINGSGSMAIAKCKAITAKAKILEEIMKAATLGRK